MERSSHLPGREDRSEGGSVPKGHALDTITTFWLNAHVNPVVQVLFGSPRSRLLPLFCFPASRFCHNR